MVGRVRLVGRELRVVSGILSPHVRAPHFISIGHILARGRRVVPATATVMVLTAVHIRLVGLGRRACRRMWSEFSGVSLVDSFLVGVAERHGALAVSFDAGVTGRWPGLGAPGADRVCPALLPRLCDRREVLAVRGPGHEDPQQGPADDVEGMVPGIHDARHSDEGGYEAWDQDQNCLPDFAPVVHDMQLTTQIEREVEQASKGG